jgi:NAD(P)-dependent dehydrogenase (short-subunit alcohol dehydrogenase family)
MISDAKLRHDILGGKNIVITGAGSDLGRSIAMATARYGASVVMLDRKQRDMNPTYDSICESGYPEPMIVEFDILKSSEQDFQLLADSLASEVETLNGLVHCAMWGAPLTPVILSSMETWQKILDQSLVKPMYLTKALLPALNGKHEARIIFPVLDVGRKGRAYWGALGCAFAGIENLCETLADEGENRNTRVNTLDCTPIRTAVRKKFYPAESVEHLVEPEDDLVTECFVRLLSDDNTTSGARYSILQ